MRKFVSAVLAAGFVFGGWALAAAEPVQRTERGNLILENVPETPEVLRDRLRQYQAARGAAFLDWSPDGRSVLIATRFGETNQLHIVQSPLGMRRQISFYDEPVSGAVYRPGTRGKQTILLSRDTGGDEVYQVYLVDPQTGETSRLSDGKSRNTDPLFSADGRFVAWTSVPTTSSNYRILVAEPGKANSTETVLEAEGSWAAADFSPDNGTLAIVHDVSVSESQIWLLDLDAGTKSQIDVTPGKVFREQPRFAPDGKSLYFITDENSEYRRLVRYDFKSGKKDVFTADIPWDVELFDLSPDGRTITFSVNAGGTSQLYVWGTRGGRSAPVKLAPGEVESLRFSADGRRIGFTLNGTSGRDAFSLDTRSRAVTQWTDSEVGGLDKASFVTPQLVNYPTFDQVDNKPRTVPAYLYKPPGTGPFPVVINIHGGPESQFRPNFSAFIQYMVLELKVAVLAPNVRGSTGYGKTYVELDNGMKRLDSVKDIGAALDWIATQPGLDAKKVAVYGGSYGGYMTYASMVEYNDRLALGVSVVGISNFVTFLNNTSGYRRDLRRVEYGDERVPEMKAFLEKISPLNNAAKIKIPIFIIQGANDPRVPASEAAQMLKAVRANGADAWYMLAKDEGHGFQKKSNRDAQNAAIAAFLKLKLLGQKLQ